MDDFIIVGDFLSLFPAAQEVELYDLATDETIFTGTAEQLCELIYASWTINSADKVKNNIIVLNVFSPTVQH